MLVAAGRVTWLSSSMTLVNSMQIRHKKLPFKRFLLRGERGRFWEPGLAIGKGRAEHEKLYPHIAEELNYNTCRIIAMINQFSIIYHKLSFQASIKITRHMSNK